MSQRYHANFHQEWLTLCAVWASALPWWKNQSHVAINRDSQIMMQPFKNSKQIFWFTVWTSGINSSIDIYPHLKRGILIHKLVFYSWQLHCRLFFSITTDSAFFLKRKQNLTATCYSCESAITYAKNLTTAKKNYLWKKSWSHPQPPTIILTGRLTQKGPTHTHLSAEALTTNALHP